MMIGESAMLAICHPEVLRRISECRCVSTPRSFGVPQDDMTRLQRDFKSPSNVYAFPFSVFRSIIFSPLRILQVLPSFDVIVAFVSLPPSHVIATSNPPRAHKPSTDPFGQALGSAGSKSI